MKRKRLQVVLDLDNTLIHSLKKEPVEGDPESFRISEGTDILYVYKRPNVDLFLKEVSKIADVHIFTASQKSYAE